jgi:hypothetical protein
MTAWVRYVDGQFIVSSWTGEDGVPIQHRPMSRWERFCWYWLKRVPKP